MVLSLLRTGSNRWGEHLLKRGSIILHNTIHTGCKCLFWADKWSLVNAFVVFSPVVKLVQISQKSQELETFRMYPFEQS